MSMLSVSYLITKARVEEMLHPQHIHQLITAVLIETLCTLSKLP